MSMPSKGRRYRLISADSHVNEPPDLWTKRVPTEWQDRAPKIESFVGKSKDGSPLKPLTALRSLGLLEALRCAASFFWVRVRPPADKKSSIQRFWLTCGFNPRASWCWGRST